MPYFPPSHSLSLHYWARLYHPALPSFHACLTLPTSANLLTPCPPRIPVSSLLNLFFSHALVPSPRLKHHTCSPQLFLPCFSQFANSTEPPPLLSHSLCFTHPLPPLQSSPGYFTFTLLSFAVPLTHSLASTFPSAPTSLHLHLTHSYFSTSTPT